MKDEESLSFSKLMASGIEDAFNEADGGGVQLIGNFPASEVKDNLFIFKGVDWDELISPSACIESIMFSSESIEEVNENNEQ